MTSKGEDSLGDWLHSTMKWSTQAQHIVLLPCTGPISLLFQQKPLSS